MLSALLTLHTISIDNGNKSYTSEKNDLLKINQKFTYISIDGFPLNRSNTINIQNNDKLLATAKISGWHGNGTKNDPIIINRLYFNQYRSYRPLTPYIILNNTDLYISLQYLYFEFNSYINNYQTAIQLLNCSNVKISENYFYSQSLNNNSLFIDVQNASNINITSNYFYTESTYYGMSNRFTNVNDTVIEFNYYKRARFGVVITYQARNLTLRSNHFINNNYGLFSSLNDFRNPKLGSLEIVNNTFENYGLGFESFYTNFNLTNNIFAIDYPDSNGIVVDRGLNSNISNNYIIGNKIGIKLSTNTLVHKDSCYSTYFLPECSSAKNVANDTLIQLHQSNVTVNNNLFISQSQYNLYIDNYTDGNTIYNNNFNAVFNVSSSVYVGSQQNTTNSFTKNTFGNYWENYNGTDSNNDQIGDTPYEISQNVSDSFPSMNPLNLTKPESTTYPESFYLNRLYTIEPSTIFEVITEPATVDPYPFTEKSRSSTLIPFGITDELIFSIGILLTVMAGTGLLLIYDYRKGLTDAKLNQTDYSFQHFVRNKLTFRKNQIKEQPKISDETFKQLEEIIEENKD